VSTFELICAGRFDEAVDACTAAMVSGPQFLELQNRGLACLKMGRHAEAIADFRRAAALEPEAMRTDAHEKRIGAAQWLAGREDEAIATWRSVVEDLVRRRYSHSDAGGGIQAGLLLWFGASRLGLGPEMAQALSWLRRRSRRPGMTLWPLPLARFVLDEVTEEQVRLEATASGSLAPRRACQAAFSAAIAACRQGDAARARALLKEAVASGMAIPLDIEFDLALHEHRR
jgi:tetratricopeptide (TPR) repeat protein